VLRHRERGAGVDVVHEVPVGDDHLAGEQGVVATGVDGDPVALRGQAARQRGDVHVLAARVLAPERGEGAGVLGDERHAHQAGTSSGRHAASARAASACGRPMSDSTAARTASALTPPRQGWPATGQRRARHPAHPIPWSPRTTALDAYGRHRAAGTVGAKTDTIGTPTAAARCAGPVLPTTTAEAPAMMAARSARLGHPPRSRARPEPPATNAVRARSSPDPVTTTSAPCAPSSA